MVFMDFEFLYSSIILFFVVINPVGTVGIFRSLLENYKKKDRARIIHKAICVATIVLLIFTMFGNFIFYILDIEIYSFMIAGGIVLGLISVDMIVGQSRKTRHSDEEENEWEIMDDLAITPLAIPLLTGPGSITTGILLYNSTSSFEQKIFVIFGIFIAFLLSYLILRSSEKVFSFLGTTGTKVITRLMGLLLLAIAVQYFVGGVTEFYTTIIHPV